MCSNIYVKIDILWGFFYELLKLNKQSLQFQCIFKLGLTILEAAVKFTGKHQRWNAFLVAVSCRCFSVNVNAEDFSEYSFYRKKVLHYSFCKKGVVRNFANLTRKTLCKSLFSNKVSSLRPATLLKRRLWHRCFPVNFAKFVRTYFLTEHLRWLLQTEQPIELIALWPFFEMLG